MLSIMLALALDAASAPTTSEHPVTTANAEGVDYDLFAAVQVNGVDTGLIVQFTRVKGDLTATRDDLRELGIEITPGKGPVRLRSIAGLGYRIDEQTQTVRIQVPAAAMRSAWIVNGPDQAEDAVPAWGGLVNYSVYGDQWAHGGATAELRLFGPVGVFSNGMLVQRFSGQQGITVQRLETRFVREDPRTLRRLIVGDFISPDGSVDGAVRGAGVQLATDFDLQPGLVTTPTPSLSGGNGVPSTVNLYVDGVRRLTQEVGAGRFAISGVPMVDGAGQVSLLVRDALGRESVQQLTFYSSRQLLRTGLTASSLQIGLLRKNAFQADDHYGPAFAAGALRRGISDRLTGEVRLAAAAPVQVTGASLTGKLGEFAILSASGDVSRSERGLGGQAAFAIRHDEPGLSLFVLGQKTLGPFETLASVSAPVNGWRLQAGGGWQMARLGQISASGTLLQQNGAKTRILATSWSRPIGSQVSAFGNLVATRSGRSGFLIAAGITIALSHRSSASVQAGRDPQGGSGSVSWSQAAEPDGGASWRAGAAIGPAQSRLVGGVTYRGESGEVGADVQMDRSGASAQLFASGAAVWLGGRPELAARIGQSFVRIETGQANIGVTLENRFVGRTRSDGSLLVPNLPTNAAARVALDYDGLDFDHDIAKPDVVLRVRGAGGSIIRMPVRLIDAVTVHLVLADGRPVPLGSVVRRSNGVESVVGYDGVAYLTDVGDALSMNVRNGDWSCQAALRKDADDPIVCH